MVDSRVHRIHGVVNHLFLGIRIDGVLLLLRDPGPF